ncbi:MAG: AAA family ATPase [Sarcina sp.]
MILGMFINGYKSYKKSHYIPILRQLGDTFSVYIGNNGVGKSAIFEALDVFFNEREWNINKGATKGDIYISPVFLVDKQEFGEKAINKNIYNDSEIEKNKSVLEYLEKITSYVYELNHSIQGATRRPHIGKFFEYIDGLNEAEIREKYYIVIIGLDVNRRATFRPLEKYLLTKIFENDNKKMDIILGLLKDMLLQYYGYLYIPVEQNVDDILKVEAKQMQILMDKNILEEIDKALDSKVDILGKQKTILKFLNEHLNNFMLSVNESIQAINEDYSYNSQAFTKKNLRPTDIREKILEAYFKKRSLKYNNREITELSSGEQRRALIDIAYAFLSSNEQKEKKIILAIDEPEVSLNIANCFSQFERLEKLSNFYKNQLLLTTHWYGFLPAIKEGNLYHLESYESGFEVKEFSFFDCITESRIYLDDIEFKSMFDLSASILSYIRSNKESKWIICEGSSDKIYFETILGSQNYKILSVGGCRIVANLYNLLSMSLKMEKNITNPKILCIVDTDEIKSNFEGFEVRKELVVLKRLQIINQNEKAKVELVSPFKDGQWYARTEIEDCLNPKLYYVAIKNIIHEDASEDIKLDFARFEFDDEVLISKIEGDESILKAKDLEANKVKKNIIKYLSSNYVKFRVASEYAALSKGRETEEVLKINIDRIFT